MSERFNGFSQDEINKVSSGPKNKKAEAMKQAFRSGGIRRMPEKTTWSTKSSTTTDNLNRNNKQQVSSRQSKVSTSDAGVTKSNTADDTMDDINLDRSLSKSLEEALFYQPIKTAASVAVSSNQNGGKVLNGIATSSGNDSDNDNSSILHLPTMDSNVSSTSNTINNSSILPSLQHEPVPAPLALNADSPYKGISLKDFESHRKMIQEQNKQKKELLYKAIEHHSQKTAAETRKIEEIKSELAKLDNDLAVDVALLRKQIDNACIQFATIEKQYVKIEAQFLKAKIDLHNASEKKELLTEHLCTVIAHNEDRKAHKLTELMEKVGLPPSGEYEADVLTNNIEK